MKDYYNQYVSSCMKLSLFFDNDFHTFQSAKRDRIADNELCKLEKELKQKDAIELMSKLLAHNDDRVKMRAAFFCFENKILKKQSVKSLKKVFWNFKDPSLWVPASIHLAFERYRIMYFLYLICALFYYWLKKKVRDLKYNRSKKTNKR